MVHPRTSPQSDRNRRVSVEYVRHLLQEASGSHVPEARSRQARGRLAALRARPPDEFEPEARALLEDSSTAGGPPGGAPRPPTGPASPGAGGPPGASEEAPQSVDWYPSRPGLASGASGVTIEELARQGHGPGRHEGDVTLAQLAQRCEHGIDPLTGSTTDAVTGRLHSYGRHATKVNSAEDYVYAYDFIVASPAFRAATAAAPGVGDERVKVSASLQDIYGPSYLTRVSGRSRIGIKADPLGNEPTDLTDGVMQAIFYRSADGKWLLLSMYPEPTRGTP